MYFRDEVLNIISDISEIEPEELCDERIIDDLGIDSLDMAQIVFRIEDELGLKIEGEISYGDIGAFSIEAFLNMLKKA